MNEQHWKALLEMNGMVCTGHYVYNSWRHGDAYVNKRVLLEPGREVDFMRVCTGLAELCAPYRPVAIVGPRAGAEKFAQYTSIILSNMLDKVVPWVPAVKAGGGFEIRPCDRHLLKGSVAMVEDIMTTGGSVKRAKTAVEMGGQCRACGIFAIVDRTEEGLTEIDSCPVRSLVSLRFNQWRENECPQCRGGVPVNNDLGHGAAFLARQG
ncbi:MAG: hypothetical protein ABIA47_03600 [bacterium]